MYLPTWKYIHNKQKGETQHGYCHIYMLYMCINWYVRSISCKQKHFIQTGELEGRILNGFFFFFWILQYKINSIIFTKIIVIPKEKILPIHIPLFSSRTWFKINLFCLPLKFTTLIPKLTHFRRWKLLPKKYRH